MIKCKSPSFIFLILVVFLGLWLRLGWLQLVEGKKNLALASGNRIKTITIPAERGLIYDNNGQPLVSNAKEGRDYLYPQILSHILGFVGEVSSEELETSDYQLKDMVGKMGLEKQYDQLLRGKKGGIIVETDAEGEVVRKLKKVEPQTGVDLHLTLDLDLQKKTAAILKEKGIPGAIVVSQPQTGAILSLVSYPFFDANNFRDFLDQPGQPMFNRAVAGLYPPGSTFKIVTAIAGLEEGVIDGQTLVEDTGVLEIERYGQKYSYANWYFTQYGGKEGMVDLVKAIKRSNDIYFYKAGEWLGPGMLEQWARYFGLGQTLEIDLPGEAAGLVPNPEWKKLQKTEAWYLGDTYITAIGQGNLLTTPLQVNQLAAIVASGGQFCQPHLAQKDKDDFCHQLEIKKEHLDLVKEGMKQACEEKGTTSAFVDFEPPVACKTGTAEIGDPQDRTHAWFTVFAPVENPEIVVTVLLEKAGEGSKEAAPVAKKILDYYFHQK